MSDAYLKQWTVAVCLNCHQEDYLYLLFAEEVLNFELEPPHEVRVTMARQQLEFTEAFIDLLRLPFASFVASFGNNLQG